MVAHQKVVIRVTVGGEIFGADTDHFPSHGRRNDNRFVVKQGTCVDPQGIAGLEVVAATDKQVFVLSQGGGEAVPGFLAIYQQSNCLYFLAQLKPMIDQFLARFREIAEAGPDEDRDILESMVRAVTVPKETGS